MLLRNKKFEKAITYFTFGYIGLFSVLSIIAGNYEFLYYISVIILAAIIILFINHRLHFYPIILLALSIQALLHLLGGNFPIGHGRLYDLYLIPNILRYDNFVHTCGSATMVLLAYALLNPVLKQPFQKNDFYFIVLLILIGMGLGVCNELLEFFAVNILNASTGVGDYTNNLLDLTYNTVGSVVMAIILVKTKLPLIETINIKDRPSLIRK